MAKHISRLDCSSSSRFMWHFHGALHCGSGGTIFYCFPFMLPMIRKRSINEFDNPKHDDVSTYNGNVPVKMTGCSVMTQRDFMEAIVWIMTLLYQ